MRRGILSFLVVLACLGLAACGGSSGSSSTTGAGGGSGNSASNVAFAAHVSSICRKANAAYNATSKQSAQVAVIEHYLTIFRAVKAPPSLSSAYAMYLGVLAKELAALQKGNVAGLIKLRDTQAGPLVRQLGATGCYA